MLFEFHRSQNAKKPNSLYATYLVSGTKSLASVSIISPVHPNGSVGKGDGEDQPMQSSPYMPSSAPQVDEEEDAGAVSVLSISLVREEDLEGCIIPQQQDDNKY